MISKLSIDSIMDAARVEDVVGDYVVLKRRGANLLGLCPFHSEKTPSFMVSPVKGIYKCFGCSKSGTAVGFLMEHDKLTYPEALRSLAKRYNIDIEETVLDDNQKQAISERESLFLITDFALQYYQNNLWETEEGKAVGLSYFKERGFTNDITKRFGLGYSFDQWNGFMDAATAKGYNPELMEKSGMVLGQEGGRLHDRFRGRVMFPIHSSSGKVLGFGARILKNDPKAAKYLNSPETPIYNKSQTLYGIYFSKKAIIEKDHCLLVEGYTDVISLHQAGVENVVASSGTSLTAEQAKLIYRHTRNVTIIYDGDAAGIKASMRGIDILLHEGLNIKILLLPDGHDPDSFSRTMTSSELEHFIRAEAKDFIFFKTQYLLKEGNTANDPTQKAFLINDIVQSIGQIPDAILRSRYTKTCSELLAVNEQILISELNKYIQKKRKNEEKEVKQPENNETSTTVELDNIISVEADEIGEALKADTGYYQEYDVIRLLILYGDRSISFSETTDGEDKIYTTAVLSFILKELSDDEAIQIVYPLFKKVIDCAKNFVNKDTLFNTEAYIKHPESEISTLATAIATNRYELSHNWQQMHQINVETEEHQLKNAVLTALAALKLEKVKTLMRALHDDLKMENADPAKLQLYMQLQQVKNKLAADLGRVIA